MKLRRTQRNLVERETANQRAIADELRHHDPFGRPSCCSSARPRCSGCGRLVNDRQKGERMQFLALIHADENGWESLSDDERQAIYERYVDFSQGDKVVGGAELQSTGAATTVRVRNGDRLVTDGPYAEVKEALGGFFILECGSIDEACELAAKIPAAEHGPSRSAPSTSRRRAEMRYALMIYSDQEPWFELSEEEAAKATEESLPKWYALFDELGKADPDIDGQGARRHPHREDGACPRRRGARHRRPVRGDEGADRRLLRRSTCPIWTRPSRSRRRSRRPSTARSRCARSWSARAPDARSTASSARSGDVRSPSSSASSATSSSPRTRCRTPSRARSSGGRAKGSREIPAAWIVTTAKNRAIDRIRRDRTLARKTELLQRLAELPGRGGRGERDPGRAPRARLHVLSPCARHRGAGRADAARGRRPDHPRDRPGVPRPPRRRWPSGSCGRSGRSAQAGIPFRVPPDEELTDRLRAVLAVLYLVFNEGYTAIGRRRARPPRALLTRRSGSASCSPS